MEKWRAIPGEQYEASSLGRIRNAKTGRIRKPWQMPNGYESIKLHAGARTQTVHTLVMAAFIGPRPEGCEINHINGVRDDNRICNLEYITHLGNMRHAIHELGRQIGAPKKLTEDDVRRVRALWAAGEHSVSDLARLFNISRATAHYAATRRSYQYVEDAPVERDVVGFRNCKTYQPLLDFEGSVSA